tara:strand:+ start:617 stop:1972 length:1356 start_codon:yes stop_codon:yes gene_type:complete
MKNNHYPPGPKGQFLLGSIKDYKKDVLSFFLKITEKYGDLVSFNLGPRKAFLTKDPYLAEHILKTKSKIYSKDTPGVQRVKEVLPTGLLTTWDEEWRRQRRISQQAFRKNKIEFFVSHFLKSAESTKSIFENNLKNKNEINITFSMMRNTLQSALSTMFTDGAQENSEEIIRDFGILNELTNLKIPRAFNFPLWFPTPENIKLNKANKNLHFILNQLIKKRRNTEKNYPDLLNFLMNAIDEDSGKGFTDEELRYQLLTILIGGVDTSANTLSFAWFLAASNRDIQEKLKIEAQKAFKKGLKDIEILSHLPYTSMFINEVVRLYPPVPIFGRTALKEDSWGKYKIPKGMLVITSPYVIHRNPTYWNEPNKFDPERHTKEKMRQMPPFCFFPYGGGPRICIGMGYAKIQLPLTIASLVKDFEFIINDGEKLELKPSITLSTKKPILLKIRKRK